MNMWEYPNTKVNEQLFIYWFSKFDNHNSVFHNKDNLYPKMSVPVLTIILLA
jgi:hypothetical protein